MISLSVYSSNYDLKYLNEAKKYGVCDIFISLHIPEELQDKIKMNNFLSAMKDIGFNIVADISPATLEVFTILELKNYNIKTLRIDYGFTEAEIVKFSKEFNIVLNASTLIKSEIKNLISLGLDTTKISALHNFYPKVETGLNFNDFNKQNKLLKSYNIKTTAFIAGDVELRGPIYEGLPTIEDTRYNLPYISYLKLCNYCDNIYIGDPKISIDQIKKICDYINGIITIKINECKNIEYILNKEIKIRQDSNHLLFRIEDSRTTFKTNKDIDEYNVITRDKGAITIDNHLALRYMGEIMLTRQNLDLKKYLNVVGYIDKNYLDILDLDIAGKIIKLVR